MTDEQGKLKPMECLDKDYYLGERDGWFSGGEDRDSDRFVFVSCNGNRFYVLGKSRLRLKNNHRL
jgi:hypothetical protein